MAFKVNIKVFEELEYERGEREKAVAEVEFYRQKCEEYEIVMERMRQRESALIHRLNLAEKIQSNAVVQLDGAIQHDMAREMNAFDELQEKIVELEESEYEKARALKDFANGLHAQNSLLKNECIVGIENIQRDLTFSTISLLYTRNNEIRTELNRLKIDCKQYFQESIKGLRDVIQGSLLEHSSSQKPSLLKVLSALSGAFNIQMDYDLFWDAIRADVSAQEREKAKNRFIATCNLPRITLLEKALEEAQNAEARAKRIALRLAAKREQEVEFERARVEHVSKKLEQALAALEKARSDFDNVSAIVAEITNTGETQ
jgi:hypothetical protein